METIALEPLEITGVEHQHADRALVLRAKQPTGSTDWLVFEGVEWWELCSFGIQNVLSSIDCYRGNSLTDALSLEHDIPAHYRQSVRAGQHLLYVLNEQVGLSGWIIAGRVRREADGQ